MPKTFDPRMGLQLSKELNDLSGSIVDSAYKVHFSLGPGLLESVYELCLMRHLTQRGLKVERQVEFPVLFEGIKVEAGLRLDLLVEKKVVVEIKAVEKTLPVHASQLLTYLRMTNHELGLLINFNVPLLKDGIKRIALSSSKS